MEPPFLAVDLDRPDALAGADVLWGREDRVVVGIAAEPRDRAALPGGAEACDVLLTGPADAPRPWWAAAIRTPPRPGSPRWSRRSPPPRSHSSRCCGWARC
ncbi:hypothetical protein ACU686_20975 [Yinghuangia aomiensis]